MRNLLKINFWMIFYSYSLSHTHCHRLSLSLSLSLTHKHTHTHTHSVCLLLSQTITLSHTHSLHLSLYLTHTHTPSVSLSHSCTHILALTLHLFLTFLTFRLFRSQLFFRLVRWRRWIKIEKIGSSRALIRDSVSNSFNQRKIATVVATLKWVRIPAIQTKKDKKLMWMNWADTFSHTSKLFLCSHHRWRD